MSTESVKQGMITYRITNKMSQREFADHIGVPHTSINRMESGKGGVNSNTIQKFCDAFGLRMEFIPSDQEPARKKLTQEQIESLLGFKIDIIKS